MFNTSKVRTAMRAFSPTLVSPGEKTRQAAVAIILRDAPMDGAEQTEVLFIQRAERPGDPWSGQMAPSLADHVSDLEIVDFPCGHWIQQEKPAETNAAMLEWLTRRYPA